MRRPLFMVCLCLVAMAALRLWWYEAFHSGGGQSVSSVLEDGEIITVTGRVHQKDTQSFVLSDVAILRQNIPFDKNMICEFAEVSESANVGLNAEKMFHESLTGPKSGSNVTVKGTFRRFQRATNPGEFDVVEYYETRGIGGKLTDITVLSEGAEYSVWRETLYALREYFKGRLYQVFPQKEASVLVAMLLGDKAELDGEVKKLYKDNGIIHILSISGLHITLIGMSIYQMLRRIGVPIWAAAICGGSILCLYGVMTGLSVSACRAIGMYLLRMLAEVVGRTYDMLTALGVLAAIMVWQNPLHLKNAGFLLSFASILAIGWFYPAIQPQDRQDVPKRYEPRGWKRLLKHLYREWKQQLIQSMAASGSITLFTLPIQLWFYYEIPVYSIFLNLLILPFMSLLMMTGLVVMILPGSGILGTITYLVLQGYEWLCECFERLPFHTWNPGKPEVWQMVVYYLILLCVAFWKSKKERHIGKILLLTLSVIIIGLHIPRGSIVTFLDVGQGDCVVVELDSGEVFVFDCGSTSRKQVGEYVLVPFLKSRGIQNVDGVFVSHPDKDHYSGIEELLALEGEEGIWVKQIILPAIMRERRDEEFSQVLQMVRAAEASESREIAIAYIGAGDTFSTEGVSFLCLHPPKGYDGEDANEYSQCIYMEVAENQISLLLTGDVTGEGERLLLQELKRYGITEVTMLKVAHHGSRYSGSTEFLQTVSPQFAIISCGENNSYGHPHMETIERLHQVGSDILTTPEHGAIRVRITPTSASLETVK